MGAEDFRSAQESGLRIEHQMNRDGFEIAAKSSFVEESLPKYRDVEDVEHFRQHPSSQIDATTSSEHQGNVAGHLSQPTGKSTHHQG